MLKELSIKKFAIIDDLAISFSEGLTVLSGETGAGKSIIINAVNLILGSRASGKLIRTGATSAEIEALFDVKPGSGVAKEMEANGYDPSEGLLVRRIISESGRHRVYINGSLGTMAILSSITENLASISGQHAHQGLLKEEQHLAYLDYYGGLVPLQKDVSEAYHQYLPLKKKLNSLYRTQKREAEQLELYAFQKTEIDDAAIEEGEDTVLEEEKKRLEYAEQLYTMSQQGVSDLYEVEGSVYERLNAIAGELEKTVRIDNTLGDLSSELNNAVYIIEDIAARLRDYGATITIDEKRLEVVNQRLDFLTRLKRKYGGSSGSLDNIFDKQHELAEKLASVDSIEEDIKALESDVEKAFGALTEKAALLSEKRKEKAGVFARAVEEELATLEMKGTRFQVALTGINAEPLNSDTVVTKDGVVVTPMGIDQAQFLIAPNVGEELRPLVKIASGGELSRVVLALKAILVQVEALGTIVFDEVDTGVGGGVAEVVGKKIVELAKFHQVICITHLPQIAKFGTHHYKIEKKVVDERTSTTIYPLEKEERVTEIARMLGGVEITRATLDHAREMMAAS